MAELLRIPPPIPGYRDGRDKWRGANKHKQAPVHGETGVSFDSLEMSILDEVESEDEQASTDTEIDEGEVLERCARPLEHGPADFSIGLDDV